jgi:hypothetical protein
MSKDGTITISELEMKSSSSKNENEKSGGVESVIVKMKENENEDVVTFERKRSQSSDVSESETLLNNGEDDGFVFDYDYPRPKSIRKTQEGEETSTSKNSSRQRTQFSNAIAPWPCLCLCGREIGRMTVCCELPRSEDNKRRILCMIGACWPISLFWVFVILTVPTGIWLIFWTQLPLAVMIVGIVLQVLTFISFSCTAFVDPGIFPRYRSIPRAYKINDEEVEAEEGEVKSKIKRHKRWRYCEEAKGWRPNKVNWDRESQVLIERIDHFCPVIGHTIARRNLLAFHSLLCMHTLLCWYLIIIVIIGCFRYGDLF